MDYLKRWYGIAVVVTVFAGTFLLLPSAKTPCACVDLSPGSSTSTSEAPAESSQPSRTQTPSEPRTEPTSPQTGENAGPAGGETGGPLSSGLEGKRYGNVIESVRKGRIDGFRGMAWGSSTSQVEAELGAPSSRSADSEEPFATVKKMTFPDEGKQVWAYEQEILNEPAYVYVAFDQIHKANDWGMIWAATIWERSKINKEKDAERIRNELLNNILPNEYGGAETDNQYSEVEKPKFWNFSGMRIKQWKDAFGRIYLMWDLNHEGVGVFFQSQALIEKRKDEVREAQSKF